MSGETTVVSPWPQQIFNTDDNERRRGENDNLKTRTFAVSQQVAEGFNADRIKAAHVDVIKDGSDTRKDISELRYAVYNLSQLVTSQAAETKMLLMSQENERLRATIEKLDRRVLRRNRHNDPDPE